jgi:hypothetical protein
MQPLYLGVFTTFLTQDMGLGKSLREAVQYGQKPTSFLAFLRNKSPFLIPRYVPSVLRSPTLRPSRVRDMIVGHLHRPLNPEAIPNCGGRKLADYVFTNLKFAWQRK